MSVYKGAVYTWKGDYGILKPFGSIITQDNKRQAAEGLIKTTKANTLIYFWAILLKAIIWSVINVIFLNSISPFQSLNGSVVQKTINTCGFNVTKMKHQNTADLILLLWEQNVLSNLSDQEVNDWPIRFTHLMSDSFGLCGSFFSDSKSVINSLNIWLHT